ncbi:sigma-70 family RNA polymerase sigma factor [Silanimonas sp.]|uniref:sigma-70 family RNA polymerase sigma factor n=1 Tax=Silanimonas sp. TaxID=1929290 RepID=UPI0022C4A38D|nr:sigma-70 family RNA polymerase sigma factor [Silanimonas sp.]MCZ8116143.1 sigma-70 family RNA polymerase sigma factor [Silanimonas sp.]
MTALALPFAMTPPPPPATALGTLFCAGREGDEARYAQALRECAVLLRRFTGAKLQRMAPGMVGDTEDVVQECLLALHLKSHTYDAAQPFEPWLYAVARYKLIDLLRRRQPGRELSLDLLAETHEFAEASESTEPLAGADLAVLLAQLPDKQRRPIELVKLEGRSVAEAAASTGLSISAVKVGIHRGLKALAKRLAAEGDTA